MSGETSRTPQEQRTDEDTTAPVPWQQLGADDAGLCVDGICELPTD